MLEHQYIAINTTKIHYVDNRSQVMPEKPRDTIIFLHGFPEYWQTWQAQLDYFSGDKFSAADIMMTIILDIANNIGLLDGKDKTLAYLDEMKQRKAYKTALTYGYTKSIN